jgi:hypothetical protein
LISAARRRTYRFALVGLTSNDARLFSSLFGLLTNRMDHEWQPVASDQPRELTVLGLVATAREIAEANTHGRILQLGPNQSDRTEKLCFPLRPTEMMFFLNAMGRALDEERKARSDLRVGTMTAAANAPITSSINTTTQASNGDLQINDIGRVVRSAEKSPISNTSHNRALKLLRWPEQQLLQESGNHLLLATLMVYRATTVAELARRSKLELDDCGVFVDKLLASGHAVLVAAPSASSANERNRIMVAESPASTSEKKSGIFAFIRRRLSI